LARHDAAALVEPHQLLVARADRRNQNATVGELLDELPWNFLRRSRRHENRVEGCFFRPTETTVRTATVDIRIVKPSQPFPRGLLQRRPYLDGEDDLGNLRQDRGLVSGSRADLEHTRTRGQCGRSCHQRNDVGLAHRLAVRQEHGVVLVGLVDTVLGQELVARHRTHRREHGGIMDPTAFDLVAHHQRALFTPIATGGNPHSDCQNNDNAPHMNGLAAVALCAGALSLLRYAFALPLLARWLRRGSVRAIPRGATPPMTLIKPLYGDEPELAENLEAALRQNYPDFEVVFTHEREDDPALEAVAAAIAAVPDVPVRTVSGRDNEATNPKVAVLIGGQRGARAESSILAAADSDVRPDPLYLRDIANGLAEADAVSFVPVLFGMRGLMANLVGLAVNTDALLGILLSRGVATTGATIGVRREALESVGGWAAVGDRIADDYALGQLLRKAGFRTVLARRAVRVRMADGGPGATARWMLRWARTIRAAALFPYLAALLLASAPLLLVTARIAGPAPGALWMLAAITLARAATALAIDLRYVWDGSLRRALPMLPLLWILEPAGLLVGLFGNSVEWRGRRYRLKGDRATLDPR